MRRQTVMVVGAAGNVGAYAVQMAVDAGIHVVAIAHLADEDLLRSLGVKSIIDSRKPAFEQDLPQVEAILDTVGGSTLQRCVKTRRQTLHIDLDAAAPNRGHFLLR